MKTSSPVCELYPLIPFGKIQKKPRKHAVNACAECHASHVRCDTQTPCSECARRDRKCIYEKRNKRGAKARNTKNYSTPISLNGSVSGSFEPLVSESLVSIENLAGVDFQNGEHFLEYFKHSWVPLCTETNSTPENSLSFSIHQTLTKAIGAQLMGDKSEELRLIYEVLCLITNFETPDESISHSYAMLALYFQSSGRLHDAQFFLQTSFACYPEALHSKSTELARTIFCLQATLSKDSLEAYLRMDLVEKLQIVFPMEIVWRTFMTVFVLVRFGAVMQTYQPYFSWCPNSLAHFEKLENGLSDCESSLNSRDSILTKFLLMSGRAEIFWHSRDAVNALELSARAFQMFLESEKLMVTGMSLVGLYLVIKIFILSGKNQDSQRGIYIMSRLQNKFGVAQEFLRSIEQVMRLNNNQTNSR